MLFNSFEFLVFFIAVTTLYFFLPHRFRWVLLLAASCVFYMFFVPAYILILFFTITVDYYAGILIENARGVWRRRWLVMSLIANLGVLVFFKYFNFLNDNLTELLAFGGKTNPLPYLNILLPIGLSFHTFQAMSYTIEVYRGRQKAERHAGLYALYVMFYPQLVAGPIERPQNLIHQFREKQVFDSKRLADGLQLMAWGLFKKVCVADRLAPMVDTIYAGPSDYYGLTLFLATALFAFQVYCDFSGYSEIAIGAARIMGIKLMKNFNCPFFAVTMQDLWSRWHISLTSWFKDYVYISMGGNRVSPARKYFNLIFTFTLSGLWHGANWGYVAWGTQQGIFLALAAATRQKKERFNAMFGRLQKTAVWKAWQMGVVFMLFCSGLVFFRSAELGVAMLVFKQSFMVWMPGSLLADFGLGGLELSVSMVLLVFMLATEWKMGSRYFFEYLNAGSPVYKTVFMFMLVLVTINLGVFNATDFIYFQF